jgi:hypothetical protein
MRQSDIRGATNHAGAIVTAEWANRPRQVNDAIACDTTAAQTRVTMRTEDVFVVNPALALGAYKLLLNVVTQIFFFK